MEQVTDYFRNAVASQSNPKCDFKKDGFRMIPREEVENGYAGDIVTNFIFKENEDEECGNETTKAVIIAFKTIENIYENGCKTDEGVEDLTSIFYVPARLDVNGKLSAPDENKEPWFPREYLEPVVEPQLAIGSMKKYDEFIDKMTSFRYERETWGQYVQYAKKLYEAVTGCPFEGDYVKSGDFQIKLESKYYIFEDKTINSTKYILNLYDDLRKQKGNRLYQKITSGMEETPRELISNLDVNKMIQHAGQMNGKYPLSPSQREAVNHFNELCEGDILAVSGPPGTGKTTLLQSVVADFYVNAALKQKRAPIIVATSMNNQPVTNIIESFRSIEEQGIANLEHKWITGADKFATYFPSKTKIQDAIKVGYQCSSIEGKEFFAQIEAKENRQNAKGKFLEEYNSYFDKDETDIGKCVHYVYDCLKGLDEKRHDILRSTAKLSELMQYEEGEKYITSLRDKESDLQQKRDKIAGKIEDKKQDIERTKQRIKEWQKAYQNLPFWIRLLKFLPPCKSHITIFISTFMDLEETKILQGKFTYEEVQQRYLELLQEYNTQYSYLQNELSEAEEESKRISEYIQSLRDGMEKINRGLCSSYPYRSEDGGGYVWDRFTIDEINNLVDKIRYKEFWLAAHYYEACWLQKETFIHTDKQFSSNIDNILDEYYHRMAMISPCFVMTTFMLPKQFLAYRKEERYSFYMYNYVDLLIVDEAGQISPEMIAGAFSLAKKAVVVGDEKQIPPVWGVPRVVDQALAVEYGVITNKDQFKLLEENGLNCSQSNIMKVASRSCAFNRYEGGLFLCEHRRCYDEIISFCNRLVYEGRLEPKRGSAKGKSSLMGLPPMGMVQVSTEYSQKEAGSRKNEVEAKAIVDWLEKNYQNLLEAYQDKGSVEKKDVVGIITPFKAQSNLIKYLLKRSSLAGEVKNISVGTVHTFQGAERQVIIFSSVYGAKDGSYFIDIDKSMMNVAVSRAKDVFLVFGDRGCFSTMEGKATKLLGEMCESVH